MHAFDAKGGRGMGTAHLTSSHRSYEQRTTRLKRGRRAALVRAVNSQGAGANAGKSLGIWR
jgi:hypothetical protein